MKIYVLKNADGEYLCFDSSYGMWYLDKDYFKAVQFKDWLQAEEHAKRSNSLGTLYPYCWLIKED